MANKKHTYGDPRGPRPKKNLASLDTYGWTREELANLLGKDVSTIGKWIKGTVDMPNEEVVTAAIRLHVHPFYILDLTDVPNMDALTDFDSFAAKRESNAKIRKDLTAAVRKFEQAENPNARKKALDLLEERYPGDYRDMAKFTADMLAMLPLSLAAHESYTDGDLLSDYVALYAATAINKAFSNGPMW